MFDLVEVGMRSIRGRHSARDRTFLKRERLSLLARRPMLGVDFEGPMKIEWQNLFPSPVFLPAASMQALAEAVTIISGHSPSRWSLSLEAGP